MSDICMFWQNKLNSTGYVTLNWHIKEQIWLTMSNLSTKHTLNFEYSRQNTSSVLHSHAAYYLSKSPINWKTYIISHTNACRIRLLAFLYCRTNLPHLSRFALRISSLNLLTKCDLPCVFSATDIPCCVPVRGPPPRSVTKNRLFQR